MSGRPTEEHLAELLALAQQLVDEGRAPTPEERARFSQLQQAVHAQPPEWRERFADMVDRLAAALEGVGL